MAPPRPPHADRSLSGWWIWLDVADVPTMHLHTPLAFLKGPGFVAGPPRGGRLPWAR